MSSVVETPVAAMADPGDLSEDNLRRMYRTMVTGRLLAERFWILSRQGKTHFVITSQGHAMVQEIRQDMIQNLLRLMEVLDESERATWLRIYEKIFPHCNQ